MSGSLRPRLRRGFQKTAPEQAAASGVIRKNKSPTDTISIVIPGPPSRILSSAARLEKPLHHLGQLLRREWLGQRRFVLGFDVLLRKFVAQIQDPRFGHALAHKARQRASADPRPADIQLSRSENPVRRGDGEGLTWLRGHAHVESESL